MAAYSFVLGMLIPTTLGRSVAKRVGRFAPVMLLCVMFIPHLVQMHPNTAETIQQTIAAGLVAALFYKTAGALGRWFERPHAVFLGRISYSLYLFNVPVLMIIDHAGHWPDQPIARALVLGSITTAIAVPIAALSYAYIERPFINLGRMTFRGARTAPS